MAAAPTDLTTLANLKNYLVNPGTLADVLLQRMLSAASVAIENYLNRDIVTTTYTKTFDGNDARTMVLPDYPIQSVAALTITGQSIPITTGYTANVSQINGYFNTDKELVLIGYRFWRGKANVVVNYTAGYGTAGSGIPFDLEQACIGLVQFWLNDRNRAGEVSRSMGGQTITFTQKDMPDWIKTTINQYRRVFTV